MTLDLLNSAFSFLLSSFSCLEGGEFSFEGGNFIIGGLELHLHLFILFFEFCAAYDFDLFDATGGLAGVPVFLGEFGKVGVNIGAGDPVLRGIGWLVAGVGGVEFRLEAVNPVLQGEANNVHGLVVQHFQTSVNLVLADIVAGRRHQRETNNRLSGHGLTIGLQESRVRFIEPPDTDSHLALAKRVHDVMLTVHQPVDDGLALREALAGDGLRHVTGIPDGVLAGGNLAEAGGDDNVVASKDTLLRLATEMRLSGAHGFLLGSHIPNLHVSALIVGDE